MTYTTLLAKATTINAGDVTAAAELLSDIASVLDSEDLTTDQRRYLYKLRTKWETRAAGNDSRWNTHGSAPGNRKRPKPVAKAGRRSAPVDDSEEPYDDVVTSILQKFGNLTLEDRLR